MSADTAGESLFVPRNLTAFLVVTLLWGGTWLVIKDQLSAVPPSWSIAYRFVVASLGMFALAKLRGEPMILPKSGWKWALGLGFFQFSLNFSFVYNAERFITSGLVAVMFALLVVPNAIFGRIVLGQPIRREFVLGSSIAAVGIALLLAQEWRASPATLEEVVLGAALTAGGIVSASAANIMQAMEGAKRLPLLTLLAWAMAIGAAIHAIFALATQGPPSFDPRPAYGLGILYLGLLGSVATFPLYYGLVRRVGAGQAAYTSVIVPVVAMVLSTLFENYRWAPLPAAGAILAMIGMVVAMRGRAAPPPKRAVPEP